MAHHGDSDQPYQRRRERGRHAAPEPAEVRPEPGYEPVVARLMAEFGRVHPADMVSRCVSAARHGAQDITGSAPPDLVERIARKHLQVLEIVAAERRQKGTLRNAAT